MKRFGFVRHTALACIVAAGALASPARAQEGPALPGQAAPSVAQKRGFEFSTAQVNFGSIREGEESTIEFPFVNRSDKPVEITNVHTGCGCTAAKDNPRVVKPGESSRIQVTFNSKGRSGKQDRTISVYTDEGGNPYQLNFNGMVVVDLFLTESRLDFGDIEAGESKTLNFGLVTFKETPLEVTKINYPDSKIEVKQTGAVPFEEAGRTGKRHNFEVTIPEGFPISDFRHHLMLTTDDPQNPNHGLMMFGRVVGDVSASPTRVYSITNVNTDDEKKVQLLSRTGAPFEIKDFSVKGNGADLNVDVTFEDMANGAGKYLVAKFKGGENPININGEILVTIRNTEKNRDEVLQIPVVQLIRRVPEQAARRQTSMVEKQRMEAMQDAAKESKPMAIPTKGK